MLFSDLVAVKLYNYSNVSVMRSPVDAGGMDVVYRSGGHYIVLLF